MYPVKQSRRVPVPPHVVDRLPVGIARREQPPLATAACQIQYGLEYMYRVMSFDTFHQFGEKTDQSESLFRLNPGDMDMAIVIFPWQIVTSIVKQYKILI